MIYTLITHKESNNWWVFKCSKIQLSAYSDSTHKIIDGILLSNWQGHNPMIIPNMNAIIFSNKICNLFEYDSLDELLDNHFVDVI